MHGSQSFKTIYLSDKQKTRTQIQSESGSDFSCMVDDTRLELAEACRCAPGFRRLIRSLRSLKTPSA